MFVGDRLKSTGQEVTNCNIMVTKQFLGFVGTHLAFGKRPALDHKNPYKYG